MRQGGLRDRRSIARRASNDGRERVIAVAEFCHEEVELNLNDVVDWRRVGGAVMGDNNGTTNWTRASVLSAGGRKAWV